MSFDDERILILTSTQKDSESTKKLLLDGSFQSVICANLNEMLDLIKIGAGALVLAKEVLGSQNMQLLSAALSKQESWSDLPVVVLASVGDLTQGKTQTFEVLRNLRNATILERPVRVATLLSVIESAVINRKRQYEVRKLVQELVHARHEAEIAKDESDRANKTKSEFLANMSHEIRTPLGIILGFTELAGNEKLGSEERKKYFAAIQRNGQQLLALVNDILDLSKVESGKIDTENIETSISTVLRDVVGAMTTIALKKGIGLNLQISSDFPSMNKTDPTRVRQIFMNIIGNAVKFTRQGSVTAKLSAEKVDRNFSKVTLVVTDTGLGISEQQKKRLFEPFSQADSSMTREFGGTGLGLVLSRQLARVLGGDLRLVESTAGVGSTFEVHFYAEEVFNHATQINNSNSKATNNINGLKVLLAEDSQDNQFIISHILGMVGVKVEFANNGIEAIEKAWSIEHDLILMDVQMPQLDGNEATKKLRDQGYQKPIIALTANALKGDKERALSIGFDDYITKPIQKNELFESLVRFSR